MNKYFTRKEVNRIIAFSALCCFVFLSHAQKVNADASGSVQKKKIRLEPILNGSYSFGPDYIGHLGGLKVRIPKNALFIIEYDGEPNWLDPEKNKYKEKPTENTGIRAMSMRFKIVEINNESFGQKSDKQQQQLENGKIILVGINSNSHFGDGNGLEMMTRKLNQDPKIVYERDTFDSYGLSKFHVMHRDDEGLTEKAKRNSLASQQDYFVKRNQYGRIETWIDCSVNAAVNNVCKHHYYPDPKRPIYVYLSYRAEYLPHWDYIQNYTTQKINSFKAD